MTWAVKPQCMVPSGLLLLPDHLPWHQTLTLMFPYYVQGQNIFAFFTREGSICQSGGDPLVSRSSQQQSVACTKPELCVSQRSLCCSRGQGARSPASVAWGGV